MTDLRMPGLDGSELLRALPERGIDLPVIVITGHGGALAAARALAAGAFDFIEKPFQDSAILGAIRAGLAVGKPDPARTARAKATSGRIARLPERERRLLDWLAKGETNYGLQAAHGVGLGDLELLRARLLRRFGVASVPELLRLVIEARRYAGEADGSL